MHVLGHALRVPADVEVGAFFKPAPEFGPFLFHPVLDVDLLSLVAGEGGGEFVEVAGFLGGGTVTVEAMFFGELAIDDYEG